MKCKYLRPFPQMPAIREAMVKTVQLKEKGVPVFDFSSGNVGNLLFEQFMFKKMQIESNRELPTPIKMIVQGISKILSASFYPTPYALGYSPATGTPSQKKMVIKYMKEVHGIPLSEKDVDRVACTAGGQLAMATSLRSIRPNTSVLISRWDYSPIPAIVKNNGCKLIRVQAHDDLSLNLNDLEKKVTDNSVYYLSMPNNPTGYTSVEDLKTIIEVMKKKQGGVIWDAPYLFTILELTPKDSPTKAKYNKVVSETIRKNFKKAIGKEYKDICILSSLSKTCLIAGLRFGFVTANKQWIANIEAIIGRDNLSAPTFSFITGTYFLKIFLENPIIHEWTCKILASRISTLIEEEMPLILPKNGIYGALYALVKTPKTGRIFAKELLNKGIVVVPGDSFYGDPIKAIRLSLVAVPWVEGDKKWIESIKVLKKALK